MFWARRLELWSFLRPSSRCCRLSQSNIFLSQRLNWKMFQTWSLPQSCFPAASSFHFSASQNSQAASFHFLHLYEGEGESRIVSYFFHFFFICFFWKNKWVTSKSLNISCSNLTSRCNVIEHNEGNKRDMVVIVSTLNTSRLNEFIWLLWRLYHTHAW